MPSFTIGHKMPRNFFCKDFSHTDRVTGSLRVFDHFYIVGIHPIANTVDGLD